MSKMEKSTITGIKWGLRQADVGECFWHHNLTQSITVIQPGFP